MTNRSPTLAFEGSTDEELQHILKDNSIALTVDEARTITTLLGRDPTLTEAIIWGIQGSEHCSYKSSRRFLSGFLTDGKHIILGPKEDSGIVAITDGPAGERWGIAISHESHNKPSQVVPFEGSATGIGGVVRDVVCMGARIVGCLDLLRLGDRKTQTTDVIASEVARGIAGYGNPLGIPNLGGDTVYDAAYNNQCLVNAIALGLLREDEIIHSFAPKEAGDVGYDIILVGKPTDRSGFGGASFASAVLDEDEKEKNTGAVQEPNPFLERHLLASSYALFDWLAKNKKLDKVSFKDLGAGGVVCASVEQVADEGFGAEIDLEGVHVSLENLPAEVIACAETQERFCWTCHPDLTEHILKHYNDDWDLPSIAENACASVVGKVTNDGMYRVSYKGEVVCEARAMDITQGIQYERPTATVTTTYEEPVIQYENGAITVENTKNKSPIAIADVLKAMLAHPNHASKADIIRHYDKSVIGNSILEAGEADAGVIAPLQDLQSYVHQGEHPDWEVSDNDKWCGVAVAGDGNGRFGRVSAYLQGKNAALESVRNVIAVGATPRALTDCLNYGNPEIPEQLAHLADGIQGISEVSKGMEMPDGEAVPIISGNVSLYNGNPDGSSIDPTAICCCIGVIGDARKAVNMQLKKADSTLYLLGNRKDECGGSAYYEILEEMLTAPRDSLLGNNVPDADINEEKKLYHAALEILSKDLALASHDISTGGLLLTLFEMTLPQRKRGGKIGIDIDLSTVESDLSIDTLLFSETGGFVFEVDPSNANAVESIASSHGVSITKIGSTTAASQFTLKDGEQQIISESLDSLQRIYYGE